MHFSSELSVDTLSLSVKDVVHVSAQRLPAPIPVYEGQIFDAFERGLSLYNAHLDATSEQTRFASFSLKLYTLLDARIIVAPALNGVILTRETAIVEEPSCFRERALTQPGMRLPDVDLHSPTKDAFVGFDRSTANYFHWLLYGVSKSCMARKLLPPDVEILLPNAASYNVQAQGQMSEDVYQSSLEISGLQSRARQLPCGVYPVNRLSFFWHEPKMPELYLLSPSVHESFGMFDVTLKTCLPRRFYISRARAQSPRVTEDEQRVIDIVMARKGIASVALEGMDFATQVALFRGAELIIAPHGAGLANLVFAPNTTAVVELNRQLDGQPHLRNCFYLISAVKRHRYAVIDLTSHSLTPEHLDCAIERVCRGV